MLRYGWLAIAIYATLIATGCGENRVISVSPASADAKNYQGGVVQFTAQGINNPSWCIGTIEGQCNGFIASSATIDSAGRAQCVSGGSGTVTVLAGREGQAINPDGGFKLTEFGSAQLTCP